MQSYEQTLRLFERWCLEQLDIRTVDKVTESVIRHYIRDLQERGKYTFYAVESQKETNHPDRRRDFRKPIATTSINNYIRKSDFPFLHHKHNPLTVLYKHGDSIFIMSSLKCYGKLITGIYEAGIILVFAKEKDSIYSASGSLRGGKVYLCHWGSGF